MGQACFERLPVGSGVKLGDAKESIKLQYISVLFEFLLLAVFVDLFHSLKNRSICPFVVVAV